MNLFLAKNRGETVKNQNFRKKFFERSHIAYVLSWDITYFCAKFQLLTPNLLRVSHTHTHTRTETQLYIYTSALARLRRADNDDSNYEKRSILNIERVYVAPIFLFGLFYVNTLKEENIFKLIRNIAPFFEFCLVHYLL